MNGREVFEVIIVGAGPAGLCAAMYAGRGMLRTAVLERGVPGGELLNTEWIDDYPGFDHILGRELSARMTTHALKFGADLRQENVETIHRAPRRNLRGLHLGGAHVRGPGGDPHRRRHPHQARGTGRGRVRRPWRVLLRGVRRRVLQGGDHRCHRRGRRGSGGSGLPHAVR